MEKNTQLKFAALYNSKKPNEISNMIGTAYSHHVTSLLRTFFYYLFFIG
jgi:hypothetical protein